MPIDQLAFKQWIHRAGYKHSCFISWPSRFGGKVKRLIPKLQQAIQEDAPIYGLPASVFIASDISLGKPWEKDMASALCESIAMVAICGPEYYESDWCGREWAGMVHLSERRSAGAEPAILPLLLEPLLAAGANGLMQVEILPPPVKVLNCRVDLSRIRLRRANYEESDEFDDIIHIIMKRIYEISILLVARDARALNCAAYELPAESTFSGFKQEAQKFPLMTEPDDTL